jgi:hypothetical protein
MRHKQIVDRVHRFVYAMLFISSVAVVLIVLHNFGLLFLT